MQVWLVLFSTWHATAAAETAPPTEPTEARSEALRVQVDHLPAQLNPFVSQDVWCDWVMLYNVLEPLVGITAGGGWQPYLASKMDISEGGRHYVFHLRPGVEFHDGRPLTSADVKFTLDKLISHNPPSELLRIELADLEEVRAPRPDAVELLLRRPNYLLPAVLAEIGILPAHVYGRFGLRNPKMNWMPIGSGPLRIVERRTKDTLTLEPHPRYWGQPARVPRVQITAIPDPARALAALRNLELDVLASLHPGYYPDQIAGSRIEQQVRALRIHPYRMRLLLYDMKHPILRERRVRLAIERLVDRERMIRERRNNLGQPLTAPLWPLSAWYDAGVHPLSFERATALRLLEGTGWRSARPGGVRMRQGRPLKLRILRAREAADTEGLAQILKADLRTAGIEAEIEVADFAFLRVQLRRGNFDLALVGLAPRPDSDLSPLLHSKGELNYGGYANAVVDALLQSLKAAGSPDERIRIARRLHRQLFEDPPFTILYAPIELMVASRRIKGLANNGRWPRLSTLSFSEADK